MLVQEGRHVQSAAVHHEHAGVCRCARSHAVRHGPRVGEKQARRRRLGVVRPPPQLPAPRLELIAASARPRLVRLEADRRVRAARLAASHELSRSQE